MFPRKPIRLVQLIIEPPVISTVNLAML